MPDLLLTSFSAHAANRSFYLGHIWKHVEKIKVADLLAAEGTNPWNLKLYWDTRLPRRGHHRGYCLVELETPELAVLAWARLDGLLRWDRKLVIGPVNKPGALRPSQEELDAAEGPRSSGSADPPPPVPGSSHGRIVYVNVVKGDGLVDRGDMSSHSSATPMRIQTMTSANALPPNTLPNTTPTSSSHGFSGCSEPAALIPRPALNWHAASSSSPLRICNDRGEVMLELLTPSTPEWEEGEKRTESLWFLLAQASGDWTDEDLREKEKTLPVPEDVGL